jgi:hypothetical protein
MRDRNFITPLTHAQSARLFQRLPTERIQTLN